MADSETVQGALTAHLVDLYRPLVDGEYLTTAGLMWLRGVLAAPGEFLPDDVEFRWLRYAVDVALAERLSVDVSLLPGWEPPPADLPPSRW